MRVLIQLAAGGTQLPPGSKAPTTNPPPTTPGSPWSRANHWIRWDHQEMRDDRVQWFADRMHAGEYVMTYQARATIDGTFTAMPATIEAMYEPDMRARTIRSTVTVTK